MNAAELFDHWYTVRRDLLRGVALLENEDLLFRPSENYPRTVGGILRHIINLERGWIHYVIRSALSEWPAEDEGLDTVSAIRSELDKVFQETMEFLGTLPVEELNRIVRVPGDGAPKLNWILWHVFEQEIHHRGELFLCLSLLGKERPTINRPS
jgi:uncharacterized damage-inducible protein DinB